MDCFKCKLFIRTEVYNQSWGMYQFWSRCKLDPLRKNIDKSCTDGIEGEPIVELNINKMY